MTIPFSSALPDPVQKLLGRPGSSGEVRELVGGAIVCIILTYGLMKILKKSGKVR